MTKLPSLDVAYIGCTESGFDIFRYIHENVTPISTIVTLSPEQGEKYGVAGYYSFSSYAEQEGIDTYVPEKYSLNTSADKDFFQSIGADVLLVHGWQRLIPDSILRTVSKGTFGLHGSPFGLPQGRGRSPMNWSLIQGLDRFLLSVMKLDEGADSGAVVNTTKYNINEYDNIRTLYYKLTIAGQRLFEACLADIAKEELEVEPQTGDPTYYPKRIPEDGAINWSDPTKVIHRLIRAVAQPYPGAFTKVNDERIYIWNAQVFSDDFAFDAEPGEILEVFTPRKDFLVKTPDGTLLITEWEADAWDPETGLVFSSLPNESINSPNRFDKPEHEKNLVK